MKTKWMVLTPILLVVGGLILVFTADENAANAQGNKMEAGTTLDSKDFGKSCAKGGCTTVGWGKNKQGSLSEVEKKLVNHFCDKIAANGQVQFDLEEVSQATGISENVLQGIPIAKLQPAIMSELQSRNINLGNVAGSACGNCSRFSACSVDRDLSGATGEELVRYEKEKAEDGMLADFQAPDFTAPTTDNRTVTLSAYRGRPVVVTFLSGHCSHSFDTLPILSDLKKKYEPLGLTILPVYLKSGSVDDVLTWSSEMDLGFPLLVSSTKELSEAYDSRMVPATFLIDEEGQVRQKFVGYKTKNELDVAFSNLMNADFKTAKL